MRSLYTTLTGKGEVVIAPFEIIGLNGASDKTRGTALAHMLQVQLREIEQNIATAQTQLMGKRPEAMVQPVQAKTVPQPVPGSAPAVALTMPPLLTQGVGLQTQLLEPAEINAEERGQVLQSHSSPLSCVHDAPLAGRVPRRCVPPDFPG